MLRGNDNGVEPDWFVIIIFHGDLSFAIGFQDGVSFLFADLFQPFRQPVSQRNRHRHIVFCFVAGVTEHNSLIARAHISFIMHDRFIDFRRLLRHLGQDFKFFCVADFADFVLRNFLKRQIGAGVRFAIDKNQIVFDRRFHRHLAGRILTKCFVQNRVGNGVADFVRVSAGDGFAGKKFFHRLSSLSFLSRQI